MMSCMNICTSAPCLHGSDRPGAHKLRMEVLLEAMTAKASNPRQVPCTYPQHQLSGLRL